MRKDKDKWLLALIFAVTIILYALFMPRTTQATDNLAQEMISGEGWYIWGVRDTRNGYSKCDGTKDLFYVAYSSTIVDAYDNAGNYQYTLTFPSDAQNGGLSIYCTPELLYVSTKDNTIYVFRGTECLGTVTRDEMREKGYYFLDEGCVMIGWDGIYRRDASGKFVWQCDLPETIKNTLPLVPFPEKLATILFFGLFIFCFGWITFQFFKRE